MIYQYLRIITQASLFRLMQTPGANILSAFEPVVAPKIKRRIIRLILNTDMAFHFDLLQSFNEGMKGDGRMLKDLVLSTLLHAADVSNPTKRFDIAKKWAMRIEEEMFLQGDKEAALGLSVSPYMDRSKQNTAMMQQVLLSTSCNPYLSL